MSHFFKNQTLDIRARNDSAAPLHRTSVVHVTEEALAIRAHDHHGRLLKYPIGAEVVVFFIRPDALYSMRSTIVDKALKPVPVLVLRLDEKAIARMQRRQHFRIDIRLKVMCALMKPDASGRAAMRETTYTRNISAGGVLCTLRQPCQIGDQARLELQLPSEPEPIEVLGKVVRVQRGATSRRSGNYVGLHFAAINDAQQARLTRYLFRLQGRARYA